MKGEKEGMGETECLLVSVNNSGDECSESFFFISLKAVDARGNGVWM